MAISSLLFFFFFIFIFIVFVDSQCLDHQKNLLLDLKTELVFNSSLSQKLVTWNQTYDCCEWGGVECDDTGRVVSLLLDYESISARIGESSTFFRLTHLSKLSLAGNDFTSTQIPKTMNRLRNLRHLDLSRSGFTGTIPHTLSNLTNLVHLDLSVNSLTGSLPSFRSCHGLDTIDLRDNHLTGSLSRLDFGSLTNLSYLALEQNSINGSIPRRLFLLPSLSLLMLANNRFSGQIEEFPVVSDLHLLDLSNNMIKGPLPSSFFRFPNIFEIQLSNNLFNGTFHLRKILSLSKLVELSLSHNKLSVDTTNFGSNFDGIHNVGVLHLASCNLHEFPYLRNVRHLDLSNNHIGGEIPGWIWETEKDYLNLSFNLLTGLEKHHYLHSSHLFSYSALLLANNRLTGAIPTSFCSASSFSVLDLSFNNLSGSIPPCLFQNSTVLNLRGNQISGVIPDQFFSECGLETFDVSNNNLGGKLPKSLGNCKSLALLNVRNNDLEGSFPCMLPLSLRILVLRSNRFHGDLRCRKSWPNLQILDISSNNFSGNVSLLNFSSWSGMMLESGRPNRSNSDYLRPDTFYQDQVVLIVKGNDLELVKIWPDFTSIDLSSNRFQGEIPDAIGNLSSLYLLNLSHNAFAGAIPKSLGGLTELGSLDLSANRLRGGIPEELAKLTFLSILNVSYNDLTGMIPTGRQFQTLSADLFEGNTGLCGFPLDRSCSRPPHGPGSTPSKPKDELTPSESKDEEIEWEYVFAASGYVVGIGSVAWTLLCCRSLRERFFEKIEEVADKIFYERGRRRRHERRVRIREERNTVRRRHHQ